MHVIVVEVTVVVWKPVGGTGSVVAVAADDGVDETPPFTATIWK